MENTRDTNSLLAFIVSFLPFKEAARTCILSKQWRNVWRETADIEFNESSFVKSDEDEETQKIQRSVLIDFVKQFIVNYPRKTIQKFTLICSKPEESVPDMKVFVSFAVSHNVRELELDFSDRKGGIKTRDAVFELPACVYKHKSLESLKLCSCSFDTSKVAKFDTLNNLSLEGIKLKFDSIKLLLEGCPLLEKLSLKKCWNMNCLEITMPNLRLKSLVLDDCEVIQDFYWIESAKLEYFKYCGKVGHIQLEYQNHMVEADLDFGMEHEFSDVGELLCGLLQELFSVQVLTVCSVLLQTALDVREFCGLKFMFRSCPAMETLTIHLGPAKLFSDYEPPYPFKSSEFWTKNLIVEPCIKQTLKVVNVKEFRGTVNELHVLRYILTFGSVMEQLNLYISNVDDGAGGNRDMYLGRAQRLLQCKKASQNLQVTIF